MITGRDGLIFRGMTRNSETSNRYGGAGSAVRCRVRILRQPAERAADQEPAPFGGMEGDAAAARWSTAAVNIDQKTARGASQETGNHQPKSST